MVLPDRFGFCPSGVSVQDRSAAERHLQTLRRRMVPRQPVLVATTSFHQAPHTEGAAPKHGPAPCGQWS